MLVKGATERWKNIEQMIACKRWAQAHILCDTSILFVYIKENTALEAVINKQNRKGNRCTLLPRSHNLPYCINYQWCHTIVTDVLKSSQMALHDPLVIIIAPQQGGQKLYNDNQQYCQSQKVVIMTTFVFQCSYNGCMMTCIFIGTLSWSHISFKVT